MSRNQYITSLENQLAKLNEKIDAKIMRGLEYRAESRQHKLLLQKLRGQKKSSLFSLFA